MAINTINPLRLIVRDEVTSASVSLGYGLRPQTDDLKTEVERLTAALGKQDWTVFPSHHERVFVLRRGTEELTMALVPYGCRTVNEYLLASSGEVRLSKGDVRIIARNLRSRIFPAQTERSIVRAQRKRVMRELRKGRISDFSLKVIVLRSLNERISYSSDEELLCYEFRRALEGRQESLRALFLKPQVPGEAFRDVPDVRIARANHQIGIVPAERMRTEQLLVNLEALAAGQGDFGFGKVFRDAAYGVASLVKTWGGAYGAYTHAFTYDTTSDCMLTDMLATTDAMFARCMAAAKTIAAAENLPWDEEPLTDWDLKEIKCRFIRCPKDFDEVLAPLVVAEQEQIEE